MDPRFLDYGTAVCAHVRHATAKEKAAIRKELADHMEDHAQALMDGGFPEDYAIQAALDSMGGAETVGRELDKEYPLRWLVLSRILIGVVILLGLYLFVTNAFWQIGNVADHLRVRMDPAGADHYEVVHESFQPLDIRWELPGDTILHLYGVTLQGGDDQYTATVYTAFYPKNPFSNSFQHITYLDFSYTLDGEEVPYHSSSGDGGYLHFRHAVTNLPEGCGLTVTYDRYGTFFQTEIPLDWEVASP